VFPEPRLCKAIVDRLTFNAHIIETGTKSWRFMKTMERQQRKGEAQDRLISQAPVHPALRSRSNHWAHHMRLGR
jgi:hypothetical protein